MPVTPPHSWPGVYIQELPSGVHTITGVATSITAFVGRTPLGPVNNPIMVTSYAEFERTFGGLDVNSPLTYVVNDFFLNGGSQALIVRVYKAATGGGNGNAQWLVGDLKLEAASPGTWSNSIKIIADSNGIDDDLAKRYSLPNTTPLTKASFFNLTITQDDANGNPVPIEVFRNVSIADSLRRVDRVLAQSSQLLLVPNKADGTPDLPTDTTAPASAAPGTAATTQGIDSQFLTSSTDFLGDQNAKTGIYALENADLFNLLCIPPDNQGGDLPTGTYGVALAYCNKRRAMLIVDPPSGWTTVSASQTGIATLISTESLSGDIARNAAIYFPRVNKADPLLKGQVGTFVPCGMIAGIMATTDSQRGVWKAPAGTSAALTGIQSLAVNMTDADNGELNPLGINCLRTFPLYGSIVWGARTMRGADQLGDDYKYVPVRRLALYIEESLYRGSKWAVFEPNDEPLWSQLRLNIGVFMHDLYRQGAFQGQSPKDAYFVQCDSTTTTQSDINQGIVNILVGFAPLKPAEFVILYLQQMAGQLAV
jgi:phage tail sheath protein FI